MEVSQYLFPCFVTALWIGMSIYTAEQKHYGWTALFGVGAVLCLLKLLTSLTV